MACSAFSQKVAASNVVAARPVARSSVVVRASNEAQSRRNVLGGFLAGAAMLATGSARADTPVDLIDDRKAKANGFDIIYEARDLDIPQGVRDGMTQMKGDVAATKTRVSESAKRINSTLLPYIEKEYWTLAREELRNQVGTLRFDLNTLVSTKGNKSDKKQGRALAKAFLASVENLDLAIRKKEQEKALKLYPKTTQALDDVLAFLV